MPCRTLCYFTYINAVSSSKERCRNLIPNLLCAGRGEQKPYLESWSEHTTESLEQVIKIRIRRLGSSFCIEIDRYDEKLKCRSGARHSHLLTGISILTADFNVAPVQGGLQREVEVHLRQIGDAGHHLGPELFEDLHVAIVRDQT